MFVSIVRKRSVAALCAAMVFTAATAVAADNAANQRVEAVRFDDLNLTQRDDVQTLEARVQRAANRVCPIYGRDLAAKAWARECRATALAGASGQIRIAVANQKMGQAQAFNQIKVGVQPQ